MHWCFNVVSDREGVPTACLVRALEPLTGLETMKRNRRGRSVSELCSGPAKLTQALGIDGSLDGIDLVTSDELFVLPGGRVEAPAIERTPRIGVAYAGEWASEPLRFVTRSRGGGKRKTPVD
jgi:DNA-3-methyladenine glycosylase